MMIELEKTVPYWWEKIADKHQQIVRMSDNAPAHVIKAERRTLDRMCDQLERYRKAEIHHKIRRFHNV